MICGVNVSLLVNFNPTLAEPPASHSPLLCTKINLFSPFAKVGIKQEPPDDVEVSKVVLTELPLRSVFQESTAPDALRESTPLDALQESAPWSPAQIEENDSRTQDTQTDDDDDNSEQDPFFEGSRTKEEECPNPEVSLNSTVNSLHITLFYFIFNYF